MGTNWTARGCTEGAGYGGKREQQRSTVPTRCAESLGDRALMNPITGIAACCARAASGNAAAAPAKE
jgi:hypothetical protein